MVKATFRTLRPVTFQNAWFNFERGDMIELQYENGSVSIVRNHVVCCVRDSEVVKLIFEGAIDIVEIVQN